MGNMSSASYDKHKLKMVLFNSANLGLFLWYGTDAMFSVVSCYNMLQDNIYRTAVTKKFELTKDTPMLYPNHYQQFTSFSCSESTSYQWISSTKGQYMCSL